VKAMWTYVEINFSLGEGELMANMNSEYGSESNSVSSLLIFYIFQS
jgi:hypothetical protein